MQQVSERLWLMRVETEMGNDRVNQTDQDFLVLVLLLYPTGQLEIVATESETELGNYRVNQTDGNLLPLFDWSERDYNNGRVSQTG